jgi:hypothetical protein
MATSVLPQFPIFTGLDGLPLENGSIFVGEPGFNAEAFPKQAYWDGALTLPAPSPTITLNGYPARLGAPGMLYVSGDFSIIVKDENGVTVYASLNNTYTNSFGTMATQDADDVAITGGLISGLDAPLPVASGGTGGATAPAARAALGIGTMGVQGAGAVAITGGTINGAAIGGTTPAAGAFTDLRGRVQLSAETSGTLTAASANRLVALSGNITLPNGVFAARDMLLIDSVGSPRTITRGSGLVMLFNGTDVASVTTAAQGTVGVRYRSAGVCLVSGNAT